MDLAQLETLIHGASVMACFAIALFFLRGWRASSDSFLLLFALAFGVFGLNRFALALSEERDEELWLYLVRLAAFLLIAIAIVQKNRARGGQPLEPGRDGDL